MSTTKSNLQYPEADLDVRAYRATSSGVSWVGNPAFARYFSLAKVVCLHPEGIVETVAKREAFDDGTGVATKNHRLANRLFGSLNSIFYDTSVVDGDKQDEVVPFEDDDGVIRREKFRSKRSYDRIVYPTEDLWEVIAALDPGMRLSELSVSSWSEASKEDIDSLWSERIKSWRKRKESETWSDLIRFTQRHREREDDEDDRFAEEIARDYLRSRSEIAEDEAHLRAALANQLRIDIEGRQKKIEDGEHFGTKFSSRKKAANTYRRIKSGFEKAAWIGYRSGVDFGLTADPKRHDSIEDAMSSFTESLQALFQRLSMEDLFNQAPDRVAVIEHNDKGHVHAHVALFGVTADEFPTKLVERYWDETRDVGKKIKVRDIGYSEEEAQWNFPHRDCSVDGYYAKSAKWMLDLAEGANPLTLTRSGEPHWKLALLWASDEISQIDRISQRLSGREEVSEIEPGIVEDTAPDWIDNSGGEDESTPDWTDNSGGEDESTPSRDSVDGLDRLKPTKIAARLLNWMTMVYYRIFYQGKPPP
jgi:hypothetical protein